MGTSEKRPLRILAADDSAVMRSILWKLFLLQKEDRSSELPRMELCGIARDGLECLEQVKQLCPDVLVLDLEMPRLNGLEVLDRLRLENSDLPVIMCSAYTEHGARSTLEALARGASDYVTKPARQRDDNARIRPGTVWLAPGDAHMEIAPRRAMTGEEARGAAGRSSRVRLHQQEPLNHCRPSVDYLFFSAARMYGAGTLALVMTGMGADGLNGAHAVHESGGGRVGQDQTPPPGRGVPGSVSGGGLAHV